MTCPSSQAGSAIASYVLRAIDCRSRNEMLLLACGSRSMSSVFRPRMASAAARLTAVVVLPTPPFWLAMATIMRLKPETQEWRGNEPRQSWTVESSRCSLGADLGRSAPIVGVGFRSVNRRRMSAGRQLHLVFPKFLWIKAFQPLLQPGIISRLSRKVDRLRAVDDRLLHEDWWAGSQG